jgi:AraC family transcriptional regulator
MELRAADTHFLRTASFSRNVHGLFLSECRYAPGARIPRHSHENASFCLALQGGCTETFGGKRREYEFLTLQYLPADQEHSLTIHGGGLSCFAVDVSSEWVKRANEDSLSFDTSIHLHGGILPWLGMKLYSEFLQLDSASKLAIEGLGLEMLAEISRRQSATGERTPQRWLEQAREFLHAHFSEQLSVLLIAKLVGVHPIHLSREFRRSYRCTMGEYVRQLRIDYACRELSASDTNLVDISSAAGFADQSHFGRTFKRFIGLTPAEYRRSFSSR